MGHGNGNTQTQPTPRRRVIATGYIRRAPIPPAARAAIARLERALDPTAPAARIPALYQSIARRILATRHMADVQLLDVARVRSVFLLTVRHRHGDRPYSIYAYRQPTPIECDPGLANPRQPGEWIQINWRDGQHDELDHLTADATAWAHHHAATRIAHLHRRTAEWQALTDTRQAATR
ncbi:MULTISPECIES: hypothetical protein [unclassified Streptomyces]|uniref:hypothetical protein n=1 Tax=unclassified Streptomyces TaxID=2593676 RepID=UPI000DD83E26|nr:MULTISPECIES: hypothetical protein [unclassified Streptomyces]QZZ26549.1 hypothetical protein A7X85_10030 [Streptomyces sp. ST1015]